MPLRSAVAQLPEDVRSDLDRRLVAGGFAGYEPLSEWLAEQGFTISKSALHRYGQTFEDKTEKLRACTRMAESLAEAVGDDVGVMNDALIRMAQGELFELLMKAEAEDTDLTKMLPEITLSVSRLARVSVQQKKWQMDARGRAEKAAAKVESLAKKGGLSPEAVKTIKSEILGVAG